jgi:dTDP-glucose pyrophosphorylase
MEESSWRKVIVDPQTTIRDVLVAINRGGIGVALITEGLKLIATVTDGDMRRALLEGQDLDSSVSVLLTRKVSSHFGDPVTAPAGTDQTILLNLMRKNQVRHLPLIDEKGEVNDLVTLEQLLPDEVVPLQAVIMAGGYGSRLRPLTEELPKPMLPLRGRPLMERVVEQLREAGIRRVNISTHYKSEKIIEHFGDGQNFGVELSYVQEEEPLGTAGALGLMETPKEPLLVINGDILTQMDFRALLAYHREHTATLTVAVRKYDLSVPYGVITTDAESRVIGLQEKPLLSFFVNAGIYLLEPKAYDFIPKNEHCDMNEVIQALLDNEEKVVSFPIHEYWIDIGQSSDYLKAQEDIENGRLEV